MVGAPLDDQAADPMQAAVVGDAGGRPGPTTVVDSRSSTIAGPSIRVPGPIR